MDFDSSNIPQKQCTNPDCVHSWFPATTEFFYRDKRRKSGLTPRCKECMGIYQRENRDSIIKYKKHYYAVNKERLIEEAKQYRESRIEQEYKNHHQYYLAHRDEIRARTKDYQRSPKGRMIDRATHHKRRIIKANAPTQFTAKDIADQMKRQRHRCYYCNEKIGQGARAYHADHIIPLSRGGTNSPDNVVIACPTCNLRKHKKLPHEWPEGGKLF